MNKPLRIGMTGGIGSGKSTAAECFRSLGVPVLDADDLTRELTAPGQPVLENIRALFGDEAISADGSLSRPFLRKRVFTDDVKRQQLEALLHPRVYDLLERYSAEQNAAYVVWVVPLLLESGSADRVDRVLVIDCPEETQIARAAKRDQQTEKDIRTIISKQLPRTTRLERADDILHNDDDINDLRQAIQELHEFYLSLSKRQRQTSQ